VRPVFIKTFGCKVNYTESVDAAAQLTRLGIPARELTGSSLPEDAQDCTIVVNSCCVTKEAERKALQFVRRMGRNYPRARVLFTGCAARHDEIQQRFSDAGAEVLANYIDVIEAVKAGASDGAATGLTEYPASGQAGAVFHSAPESSERARAFIKVQDGCTCRCSYCIIPDVRPYYTRRLGAVLDDVQRFTAAGYNELVLTGINAGCYGRAPLENTPDYSHPDGPIDITGLIESVLAVLPAGVRLRLSSIEPLDVTDGLVDLLGHPRFCQHLHLPLQSGSDSVLSDMGRPYSARQYLDVVERIRAAQPGAAVTTDILVGYPTETEDDFAATLALCDSAGFERIHGFPFSPRPGTPAAELKLLPGNEVRDRNRRLIEHCAGIADARWSRYIGAAVDVLIEEQRGDGHYIGHGPAYQVVRLSAETPGIKPGGIYPLRLTGYADGEFTGAPA